MTMTRTEIGAVTATGVLAVGLLVAILLDSWHWSFALLGALTVLLALLVVVVLRRQDARRSAALERLERKIDNVALRVVTEAQATHRELSGLIEELGADLQRRDQRG